MTFNIDWHALRAWSGSQNSAFEKLCCQLAAHESVPTGSTFIPKGAPDAGVECFWVYPDGGEWGLQAKFFLSPPGPAQWKQIDESVNRALESHPRLVRYTICLPIDRPDPRNRNQKSFMDRWKQHERSWKSWAKAKNNETLVFVYWGATEILDRLALPQHRGRVYFWFHKDLFTDDWFSQRVANAISNVGPRYTPEINVELPISMIFEGLGRTSSFFIRLARLKGDIRRQAQRVSLGPPTLDFAKHIYKTLQERVAGTVAALNETLDHEIRYLDFGSIAKSIDISVEACWSCLEALKEYERAKESQVGVRPEYQPLAFSDEIYQLKELLAEFHKCKDFIDSESALLANVPALLLRGEAGTGKTHLLCDVAKARAGDSHATILLLGKHFGRHTPPWSQIIQMLGLTCSPEEFLGALQAVAEADGRKALIIVDGLNEGDGRFLWPDHLHGFLTDLRYYPWISVALSIRTTYEDVIVPKDLAPDDLLRITHFGFAEHEYEATRTFFEHYKINRPRIPLITPEFENPLFLKLFCEALHSRGLHEIEAGISGITAIFDFFLASVNEKLSTSRFLNFDKKTDLVKRAIDALSAAMASEERAWLGRDAAKVIVDAFLPGRGYEDSLFRHLISEGILAEDRMPLAPGQGVDIVHFAYERFGDHLFAKDLLQRVVKSTPPEDPFMTDGFVGRLITESNASRNNKGVLDALSIQVPETLGKELIELIPSIADRGAVKDAFLQSLLFRDYAALRESTHSYVKQITANVPWYFRFLDTILLVASVPQHRYNARFLHSLLGSQSLVDRDSSWSVFLFRTFGEHGSVDRLLEWSTSTEDRGYINDESLELCGIALGWFLTSSHRYVRDQATKGLVHLFQNRLDVLDRVIVSFSQVNDPYVSERLCGVAYGSSMRTTDLPSIGRLAQRMYTWIFKDGKPPADILLRDAARGVIELALYKGLSLSVDLDLIRPPYGSEWPNGIPTEHELSKYDERREGMPDYEYAQFHLYESVMGDGDFARYIIGTNSGTFDWSRRRIGEPLDGLNRYEDGFDLSLAQRFVFNRVLELGWTAEKFGAIDIEIEQRADGREEQKPERIGKKYQWIAFHELLARVADNFIFLGDIEADQVRGYQDPSPMFIRDIDPSCLIAETKRNSNRKAWWSPVDYDAWSSRTSDSAWLRSTADLPEIRPLLVVTRPADKSEWIVLECLRDFDQPTPPDLDRFELPRRRIWYWIKSYLVRRKDLPGLFKWLGKQNFSGRWMPEAHELTRVFLGEFFWASAFLTHNVPYYSHPGWTKIGRRELPAKVHVTTEMYMQERGYDCSIHDTIHIWMPSNVIADGMSLQWKGFDGKLFDGSGLLVAEDPTIAEGGPHAVLVKKSEFLNFLKVNDLGFLWTVQGEKQVLGSGRSRHTWKGRLEMSAAYRIFRDSMEGARRTTFVGPNSPAAR